MQAWAGADESLEAPSAWQFSDSESDLDNELTDSEDDDDDSPFDEIDRARAHSLPACLPAGLGLTLSACVKLCGMHSMTIATAVSCPSSVTCSLVLLQSPAGPAGLRVVVSGQSMHDWRMHAQTSIADKPLQQPDSGPCAGVCER